MIYEKIALMHPTDNSVDMTQGGELVRSNSIVPGSRFRQGNSYQMMQMEIKDEQFSTKLARFTENNRTLLNIILTLLLTMSTCWRLLFLR